MPNEMLERIARAICAAANDDPEVDGVSPNRDPNKGPLGAIIKIKAWELYIPEAKAAIEAMREPTHEMFENSKPGSGWWHSMIDAALQEK